MDSEKSQGSVLRAILHAKDSNRIQGIYGRMGDLGAIDGKCCLHHSLLLFSLVKVIHSNGVKSIHQLKI